MLRSKFTENTKKKSLSSVTADGRRHSLPVISDRKLKKDISRESVTERQKEFQGAKEEESKSKRNKEEEQAIAQV